MSKTMTPSTEAETTTAEQINKAVANFRAMLEKRAPEFDKQVVQQVLGLTEYARDTFAVFRKYVEMFAKMIVHFVTVDRNRTPEQVITATGRKQYVDTNVVKNMPKGGGRDVRLVYFQLDRSAYDTNGWISDDKLEEQFALRHLKPADPYSLAADNEADPAFADEHPNATHWKDADSNWCYAAFDRWFAERRVLVVRYDDGWSGRWWFAGLASSPQA